jgi:hypothetical protein
VSVNDRWVGPHEQVLNVPTHAGDMGPMSLVACHQQRVSLPPLHQWLSLERNWVRTHELVSRCAVDCVGSPFSQEQWLCLSLLTTSQKVAMC